jgi:hypothetical protein
MKNENNGSIKTITFSEEAQQSIHEFIGKHPAERGGALGADADGVIRHFAPDPTARCSPGAYDPDLDAMNTQIREWKKNNIRFVGFAHSHPRNYKQLSPTDEDYAAKILNAFKSLDRLCLPIVMTVPDSGRFELIPFVAIPDSKDRAKVAFEHGEIAIEAVKGKAASARVEEAADATPSASKASQGGKSKDGRQKRKSTARNLFTRITEVAEVVRTAIMGEVDTRVLPVWRYFGDFPSAWTPTEFSERSEERARELDQAQKNHQQAARYFDRVQSAYDLPLLDGTRLVIVGNGGAASFIRDCARCGVGEFVLIDHDTFSESNVGSQSADPAKIGTAKAEALAEEIRIINPASSVLAMACKIEDITDVAFEEIIEAPLRFAKYATAPGDASFGHARKSNILLLGLTDNFHAQARVHRLGLQYGLPTICAQEYAEGRGAEVTWTVPGVTKSCHRCMTASRYQAYARGFQNNVTSHGAPIFAAQMLNAVLGQITLAVAHHESGHPRYGNWLTRMGDRNLALLRIDPDFDEFMGRPVFGKRLAGANEPDAFFMMDTLFLAQTPDAGQSESRPVCADCGGTGDLGNAIGNFRDTRKMRQKLPK